ncbi:MAG: PAS domain S-box protein [Armatimonadetes bacterium]|nr:PAS domain S-box protein [Armatimonadota bacterium]
MTGISEIQLDYIYFFYGLGFIMLAGVCFRLLWTAKDATANIAASEGRYRSFVDGCPSVVVFADREGRLTNANQAGLGGLGFPEAEMAGKRFVDLWTKPVRAIAGNAVALVMEGKRCSFEADYVRPDGRSITYYVVLNPITDRKGGIAGFAGILTDVTDSRHAERMLAVEKERLAVTLRSIGDGVIATDTNGSVTLVNGVAEKLTGWTEVESIGRPLNEVFKIIHEITGEEAPNPVEQALKTGDPVELAHHTALISKDGSRRSIADSCAPVWDVDGNMIGVVLVFRDVTQRMRAEDALRDSEAKFRAIMSTVADALIIIDNNGRVSYWNPAAERMFGYLDDEVIGRNLHSIVAPPKYVLAFKEAFKRFRTTGEGDAVGKTLELAALHKDGREFPVELSISAFKIGDEWFATGVVRDITERKQAQGALEASEERYRTLFSSMSEGFALCEIICDEKGKPCDWRYLEVNQAFEQNTGLMADQVVGKTVLEVLPNIESSWIGCYGEVALTGKPTRFENRVEELGRDFEVFAFSPARGQFAALFVDTTERKRAEEAIKIQTSAMNAASDQIVITNVHGVVEFVNPAFEKETGFSINEVIGKTPRIMKSGKHDAEYYNNLWLTILNGKPWSGEITNRRKDGSIYVEDMTITPIKNDSDVIEHFVAVKRNITLKKAYEEQLDYLAYHDPLTGLPNRLLFSDRLTQRLAQAQRGQSMIAVMFLDVDRFKLINDTLGHNIGDLLLQGMAERLQACVREADTIARMGGDEFTIILADVVDPEAAGEVARRVLRAVASPFVFDEHELYVTTSIGISIYPADGTDVETLVKNADTAMYRAKEKGRNMCQLYTEAFNAADVERMTLENNLRRAAKREEFLLHFQPQVDIRTGETRGSEALVRWRHPEYGLVPPGKFIPLAEETGLIVPISKWIIKAACGQNKAWQDAGYPPITIAVNISAKHFHQEDLAATVGSALSETGLDPQYLELELTESALMQNPDLAVDVLGKLKEMGVRISVDDFGTGYSSLSYLKRFPIDAVKIDQSFVRDITTNHDDAAIAGAVVAMAHSLKLKVIAEGVETLEQLEFLRSLKCDEVQGYFIGRPVPAEEFGQLLEDVHTPHPATFRPAA